MSRQIGMYEDKEKTKLKKNSKHLFEDHYRGDTGIPKKIIIIKKSYKTIKSKK